MGPIRSIAELPFARRSVADLLNLEQERDQVDTEDTRFGWALAGEIWLVSTGAPAVAATQRVDGALVLGLHSADDAEPHADDIELEFAVAEDVSMMARASGFCCR